MPETPSQPPFDVEEQQFFSEHLSPSLKERPASLRSKLTLLSKISFSGKISNIQKNQVKPVVQYTVKRARGAMTDNNTGRVQVCKSCKKTKTVQQKRATTENPTTASPALTRAPLFLQK